MDFHSSQEKTESPTFLKIQNAQQKGFINYSYELNLFFILIIGFLILYCLKKNILFFFMNIIAYNLKFDHSIINNNNYLSIYVLHQLKKVILLLLIFCILVLLAIIGIIFLLNGFCLYFVFVGFNWYFLDIINNLNNIFSYNNLIEAMKFCLKILIFFIIICMYVLFYIFKLRYLVIFDVIVLFQYLFNVIIICILWMFIGFIPIVIVDILWKKFVYYQNLKMSIQEVKEEYQIMEGNYLSKKKYIIKYHNHYKKNNKKLYKSQICDKNTINFI